MLLLRLRTKHKEEIIFFQRGKRGKPSFAHSEWIKITILAFCVRPKKSKLQMSKHLTVEQRYSIYTMLQIPMTQKDIAAAIGVHKSTISRELKRNCDMRSGKYIMDLAQPQSRKTQERKAAQRGVYLSNAAASYKIVETRL